MRSAFFLETLGAQLMGSFFAVEADQVTILVHLLVTLEQVDVLAVVLVVVVLQGNH